MTDQRARWICPECGDNMLARWEAKHRRGMTCNWRLEQQALELQGYAVLDMKNNFLPRWAWCEGLLLKSAVVKVGVLGWKRRWFLPGWAVSTARLLDAPPPNEPKAVTELMKRLAVADLERRDAAIATLRLGANIPNLTSMLDDKESP